MEHFLKFLVVGSIGFLINTTVLIFGVRKFNLKPSIAGPIGAELAIISNFILNNFWTFSDKTITSWSVLPQKFIAFNILSLGSAVIQFIFLKAGEIIFGLEKYKKPVLTVIPVKKIPVVNSIVEALLKIKIFNKLSQKMTVYFVFYIAGVGVGLIVNFFIYSLIIWR